MGRTPPGLLVLLAAALAAVLPFGLCQQPASPALTQQDYADLAQGVGALTFSSSSSLSYLFGSALAVATTADGRPLVSAVKYGAGRLMHFPHQDMAFSCCSGSGLGLGRLLVNSAGWLAGNKTEGIRIAALPATSSAVWETGNGIVAMLAQQVSLGPDLGQLQRLLATRTCVVVCLQLQYV
jgi:hypothetical protein